MTRALTRSEARSLSQQVIVARTARSEIGARLRFKMSYKPTSRLILSIAAIGVFASTARAEAQGATSTTGPVTACRQGDPGSPCVDIGGDARITFGGEYRVRGETLDPANFGIAGGPQSTSIAHRAMLDADLRVAKTVRLYVQLSYADQSGRKPVARAFDVSDPDLAQAFIEIPFAFGGTSASVRLGRQELSIGNRLVALRDGVTLRRAFDGGRIDITAGAHKIIGFYLSPVLNKAGAFDDRRTRGETFAGLSWQLPGTPADGVLTLFAFDRERGKASYLRAAGAEDRQTFGLRYTRTRARWDMATQFGIQTGHVGASNVLAWGGSLELGLHPKGTTGLRIGAQLGIASGDTEPDDNRIGTFDPLYPNLVAFNDAPLYYYSNQMNAQLNVSKSMGAVILRADATLLARATSRDAIYASPGRPLAFPTSGDRLSAATFEASARWRVSKHLEFYGSLLRAQALDSIRAAGGRDTNFALIQMTAGF